MDVNVPISGVKPGCGPTIHAFSAAAAGYGKSGKSGETDCHSDAALQEVAPIGHTFEWEHRIFLRRGCDSLGGMILRLEHTGE